MKKCHLIFLAGMLFVSCSNSKQKTASSIQTVKIDTVHAATSSLTMQFPGRVKASEEVSLSFKVNGRIQQLYVKEGDFVKAGQLVAAMDPTDYEVQLRATQAEHDQIVAEADRVIAMYEENGTTANNRDKAFYGKQQIEAKLKNHQDQLSYTKLYAPMSGYIQDKIFAGGEIVSAGMPVLTMIGNGTPEVEISLPATEYAKRQNFNSYSCTFDVYPGRTYPLRLINILPKANANQLYTMRLSLQGNAADMPSPGMNTMVTITQSNGANAELTLPTGAILQENGKESVFVYNPDSQTLIQRSVKLIRLLNDGRCLVTSDQLNDGDLIVASGTHHVKNGEKVRPLKPTSKTNVGGLL